MQPTRHGFRITLLAGVSVVALAAASPNASAADMASPMLRKAPPPLPPKAPGVGGSRAEPSIRAAAASGSQLSNQSGAVKAPAVLTGKRNRCGMSSASSAMGLHPRAPVGHRLAGRRCGVDRRTRPDNNGQYSRTSVRGVPDRHSRDLQCGCTSRLVLLVHSQLKIHSGLSF